MLYRNMKKIMKMLKNIFDDIITLVLYSKGLLRHPHQANLDIQ